MTRVELGATELAGLVVEVAPELETAGLEVVPEAALHLNWIWPISQVAEVLEKPLHTKAVTALALAPVKEVSGMLMVWVEPVRPETV